MCLVKLTASSFFDLISKQARPDCHCKRVLVLFIYFIYFATQNVQRKKGKKYTKEQKYEALNRNHRAYTVRLLHNPWWLHMQKSLEKNLEFWIQKSVQTLEREIELQMSLSNACPSHISYVECGIP